MPSDLFALALRNPYDLGLVDPRIRTVACYSFSPAVADVLERLLKGEFTAEGVLPIGLGGLDA